MLEGQNGPRPQDHIRLAGEAKDLACGAIYEAHLSGAQKDGAGEPIAVAIDLRRVVRVEPLAVLIGREPLRGGFLRLVDTRAMHARVQPLLDRLLPPFRDLGRCHAAPRESRTEHLAQPLAER